MGAAGNFVPSCKEPHLGFIVSDMQHIENIYINKFSETPNYITPFLIVSRNINSINVTTYHHFESSDINFEQCRNYFIMLVKMSLALQNSKVLNDIVGYFIPHETHDKIQTGDTHLSEVFAKKNDFHQFHLDDFDKVTPTDVSTDGDMGATEFLNFIDELKKISLGSFKGICKEAYREECLRRYGKDILHEIPVFDSK